jgi:hypothetical protein
MARNPEPEAIAEELQRARVLRMTVDLTANILIQQPLSWTEALELVAATRRRALELFPEGEGTFDLVLKPRFERLLRERFGVHPFPPKPEA